MFLKYVNLHDTSAIALLKISKFSEELLAISPPVVLSKFTNLHKVQKEICQHLM